MSPVKQTVDPLTNPKPALPLQKTKASSSSTSSSNAAEFYEKGCFIIYG